jgi:hypothetical protein
MKLHSDQGVCWLKTVLQKHSLVFKYPQIDTVLYTYMRSDVSALTCFLASAACRTWTSYCSWSLLRDANISLLWWACTSLTKTSRIHILFDVLSWLQNLSFVKMTLLIGFQDISFLCTILISRCTCYESHKKSEVYFIQTKVTVNYVALWPYITATNIPHMIATNKNIIKKLWNSSNPTLEAQENISTLQIFKTWFLMQLNPRMMANEIYTKWCLFLLQTFLFFSPQNLPS